MELQENAKPYHAKSFLIPKAHKPSLKKEFDKLIKIGVLKKSNNSQWVSPIFVIPKINGTKNFFNFRELNIRIKWKPFPIPNYLTYITWTRMF